MAKFTPGVKTMRVEQLMSQPVHTCMPDDSLADAARLMWDHDCGAIAVIDDDGKLVGMVTDRDICMAGLFQGKPLHAIPVAAVMAKDVHACEAGDAVETAERLMQHRQVRRVPVLSHGRRPVGMLSLNDIARETGAHRKNGADRELVQTLAAICEPRAHSLQPLRPA